MKSPELIGIGQARIIASIFNMCYKTGVSDAEEIGDSDLYESFSTEVSVPGVYGRITEYQRYSVHQWRISLLQMNRNSGRRIRDTLLDSVIDKGYINCMYPISQDFYLMGVRDFNANPHIHDFTLFDSRRLERWTKRGIKSVSYMDMLVDIQASCLNRSVLDSDNKNIHSFPRRKYETFAERMWLALSDGYSSLYEI